MDIVKLVPTWKGVSELLYNQWYVYSEELMQNMRIISDYTFLPPIHFAPSVLGPAPPLADHKTSTHLSRLRLRKLF